MKIHTCTLFLGLTPMERLEYQARSGDPNAPPKKVPPNWVTDSMWKQCQHLDSSMPSFDGLCRSLITDHVHWELFKQMEDPFKGMQTSYKDLSKQNSPSPFNKKNDVSVFLV